MLETFEFMTIERSSVSCGYSVYGHGEYEESSVLAGQYRRAFLDSFDTLEEAVKAYPQAEVIQGTTCGLTKMPSLPPDWFDPVNAGEQWEAN